MSYFILWMLRIYAYSYTFEEVTSEDNIECQSKILGCQTKYFNTRFKFIKGIKNTLTDTLSRLINL